VSESPEQPQAGHQARRFGRDSRAAEIRATGTVDTVARAVAVVAGVCRPSPDVCASSAGLHPTGHPGWPDASQQGWPAASQQGWPTAPQQGGPSARTRRGLWTGVTLVAIAIIATLIAVLVSANTGSSGSSKSSASGCTVLPNPVPSLGPSPAPSPSSPQNPLPSLARWPLRPGLLAIDYHAYSLRSVEPSDIALDSAELAQFKKYGLSRVAGLRALTLGATAASSDDWDADINILRFSSPAAAQAEPELLRCAEQEVGNDHPAAGACRTRPAFVNHDSTTGISIGAFTTVGRYQVVVILRGLSENVPTNATVVAAEAAKVMKAVLPDAATIIPPSTGSGGGTGPVVPGFPTPSPTGTHA